MTETTSCPYGTADHQWTILLSEHSTSLGTCRYLRCVCGTYVVVVAGWVAARPGEYSEVAGRPLSPATMRAASR